jgi:hypothetical protein
MVGALIQFHRDGRVKEIAFIGGTENEVATAEASLARILQPGRWERWRRWLKPNPWRATNHEKSRAEF